MKEQLDAIAKKALALAQGSDDPLILEKSASICKLTLEAQHALSDVGTSQSQSRGNDWKFLVSNLTPLVAILSLLVTTAFQGYQLSKTSHLQLQQDQNTQWREGIKLFTSDTGPGKLASITFLQSFLDDPRYGTAARFLIFDTIASASSNSKTQFLYLITSTFKPTWQNLQNLVDLDRALYLRVADLQERDEAGTLTDQEKVQYRNLRQNVSFLGNQMAEVLRSPRPENRTIDLRNLDLWDADFSGTNLRGLRLDHTSFVRVALKDADLCDMPSASDLQLPQTAWWEAAHISPDLLGSLQKNSPFDPRVEYPRSPGANMRSYEQALTRLHASGCGK